MTEREYRRGTTGDGVERDKFRRLLTLKVALDAQYARCTQFVIEDPTGRPVGTPVPVAERLA